MSTVMCLTAHIYCSVELFFDDLNKINHLLNLYEDGKSSLEIAFEDYEKEEENKRKFIYEQKLVITGDKNGKLKKDTLQALDSAGFFKNIIFEAELRRCSYKRLLDSYLVFFCGFEDFFPLIELKSNVRTRYQIFRNGMLRYNRLNTREDEVHTRQVILQHWIERVYKYVRQDGVCLEKRILSSKLLTEKVIRFYMLFSEIGDQYKD